MAAIVMHCMGVGLPPAVLCAGLPSAVFAPWVDKLVAQHHRQQERQPALAAAVPASTSGVNGSSAGLEAAAVPLPPPQVVTLDAELEPLLLSKAAQVCTHALLCITLPHNMGCAAAFLRRPTGFSAVGCPYTANQIRCPSQNETTDSPPLCHLCCSLGCPPSGWGAW